MTAKRRGPEYGCRNCEAALTDDNWSWGLRKYRRYWCNPCFARRQRAYADRDPLKNEKTRARRIARQKNWTPERLERERRKTRNRGLRKTYGLTLEQYEAMLARQGGKCHICFDQLTESTGGRGSNQVHVDHCHRTNIVRGILCGHCNRLIGMARERAWVLHRAADYISAIRTDAIVAAPKKLTKTGRPTIAALSSESKQGAA